MNTNKNLSRSISTLHKFVVANDYTGLLKEHFDGILRQIYVIALGHIENGRPEKAIELSEIVQEYAFNDSTKFRGYCCYLKAYKMNRQKTLADTIDVDDFYIDEFEID